MSDKVQRYSEQDMQRHAEMLVNRVRKNLRHFAPRFRKQNIEVFRLYNWDIPEIRAIVDWYQGQLVLAEYVREQTAELPWLETMGAALGQALDIKAEHIHLKRRRTRPKSGERYQRLQRHDQKIAVRERELRFLVNLEDFVDTGLFADHRETRLRVCNESQGKDVLNLYAYTGSFSCYAAFGGAKSTTSVDTSGRYLKWAKENMLLNNLMENPDSHQFVEEDVMQFLTSAARKRLSWDLMIIDPPSYSDRPSGQNFSVQDDHVRLLNLALAVLKPGGRIYFSTNHQRFTPMLASLNVQSWQEISLATVPEDYRKRPPHRCFLIDGKSITHGPGKTPSHPHG